MKSLFSLRPRRVVAAFVVLGALTGVGVISTSSATADCAALRVYTYSSDGTVDDHSNGTTSTVYHNPCITNTPFPTWMRVHRGAGVDALPAGTVAGAGAETWVFGP